MLCRGLDYVVLGFRLCYVETQIIQSWDLDYGMSEVRVRYVETQNMLCWDLHYVGAYLMLYQDLDYVTVP